MAISVGRHTAIIPRPVADTALASGCANEGVVAVLPESNGHVGAVVVESGGNKTLLNTAYAACSGSKPMIIDRQQVAELFGDVLAALPTPPVNFQLYYQSGSITEGTASLRVLDDIRNEIARRKAAEVVVTGFTDTVGRTAFNDRLSLARAQSVSKLLTEQGLTKG